MGWSGFNVAPAARMQYEIWIYDMNTQAGEYTALRACNMNTQASDRHLHTATIITEDVTLITMDS